MVKVKFILFTTSFAIILGLAGCAGFGSGGGSNLPTSQIQTLINKNGVNSTWTNAQLSGSAIQYGCSPGNDSHCSAFFGPVSTGSSGTYLLSTDAIPGYWDFNAPHDSECAQNTDSGLVYVSASVSVPFVCGQPNSDVTVSPSSCTQRYTNGGQVLYTNKCPATITLTSSNHTLPTTRSLSVSSYTQTGSLMVTASAAASSTTTINVAPPIPQTPINGTTTSVVLVRDPSNNNVLMATVFQVQQYVSGVDK